MRVWMSASRVVQVEIWSFSVPSVVVIEEIAWVTVPNTGAIAASAVLLRFDANEPAIAVCVPAGSAPYALAKAPASKVSTPFLSTSMP